MKTPKGKEVFVFEKEKIYTIFHGKVGHWTIEDGELLSWSYLFMNVPGRVKYARLHKSWRGKEITDFSTLPEQVQKYVEQISE